MLQNSKSKKWKISSFSCSPNIHLWDNYCYNFFLISFRDILSKLTLPGCMCMFHILLYTFLFSLNNINWKLIYFNTKYLFLFKHGSTSQTSHLPYYLFLKTEPITIINLFIASSSQLECECESNYFQLFYLLHA